MTGVELFTIGTTAITLADAITGVSALIGAASALGQASAQSQAAETNAAIARAQAIQTRRVADFEESRHRERVRRFASAQRAAFGKAGVTPEGSPLLVMAETAAEGELDALAIRFSASVGEAQARSQAAQDRLQAGALRSRGLVRAGSSILTGVSQIAATKEDPLGS